MKNYKIAILTSDESWFVPFAVEMKETLKKEGYLVELFFNHETISKDYHIVFILSYFKIIKSNFLKKHNFNLVVHESALPEGKGWAPLFWQILEGKNRIPIVLFKAGEKIDSGNIYLKDYIELNGNELHDEIRYKQATKTIELCSQFLKEYNSLNSFIQKGKETFYRRRTPEDSELDINKPINEHFNLLRIVDNKKYPAYFIKNGIKYTIRINKD